MRVHWTDRAKARLHKINGYLTEQNPEVAKKVTGSILNSPEIGHKVKGYEDTDLREILIRPYRLIYRIKVDQVDIVAVLHYRQLLPMDLGT